MLDSLGLGGIVEALQWRDAVRLVTVTFLLTGPSKFETPNDGGDFEEAKYRTHAASTPVQPEARGGVEPV